MALDNYNRTDSLNAIVEAWTRFGSLPFILQKTIPHGASATFEFSNPYRGILYMISYKWASCGETIINCNGSAVTAKQVVAAGSITESRTGNKMTLTNGDTVDDVTLYFIALTGSAQEV